MQDRLAWLVCEGHFSTRQGFLSRSLLPALLQADVWALRTRCSRFAPDNGPPLGRVNKML